MGGRTHHGYDAFWRLKQLSDAHANTALGVS
jgi:hypothetical protein